MFTIDETIIVVNLYLQSKTVVIRSKIYFKKNTCTMCAVFLL